MAKDPAFLFYSKDFFEGTRMMLPEERAAYVDLLTYQHQNGYIPDDPKRLSMYCTGVSEATIKAVLEAKFKLCLGLGWINEKLSQVTEDRKEHSKRQSVNGTVGQFWKKSRAVLKDDDFFRLKKYFTGKNNDEILEIIEGKEVNEAMLIAMLKQKKEAKRKHLEDASAIENADAIAIEDKNEKGGLGEKTNQAEENGKKTTFRNSPLFDRAKYDAELSDWPLEKRNYYYEAAITWSDDHQTKKDQSVNWARRLRGWDRMHPWNGNKNGSATNGNHYPKTESQRIVNTVNHGAFLQGNDAVWCTIPGTFFSGNLTLNKEGNIEYWNAGKTVLTIYVKNGYKSNRVYKLKDGNTIQKVHEYLLKESQIKVA